MSCASIRLQITDKPSPFHSSDSQKDCTHKTKLTSNQHQTTKLSNKSVSKQKREFVFNKLAIETIKFIEANNSKKLFNEIPESIRLNATPFKMFKKHADFLANRSSTEDKIQNLMKPETLNQVKSKKPRRITADKLYRVYATLKQTHLINKKYSERRRRETTIEELSVHCDRSDIHQAIKDGCLRVRTIKNTVDEKGSSSHGDTRKVGDSRQIVLFPKTVEDGSEESGGNNLDWYCFHCHKEVKKFVLEDNVCTQCTRVFCYDTVCKNAYCCAHSIQTEMLSVLK